MSWPLIPASELMLKRGGSINPSKFLDETFELLSIPAYDKNKPEILKGAEIGSSKSCIEPNDVLLSKIIPHTRRCWVVPNKGKYRQIGSGEWIIFRDKRFVPDFLRHFLTSNIFHQQFMSTVAGVGGSLVRARPTEVERIEIPLPPLPEQERIAAILDKADAIRRKRQQAIQLADDFLRSVFLDVFGDPVTNPKGWEIKTWQDVMKIVNGKNQKKVATENGKFAIMGSGGEMGRASDYLTPENSVIIGRKGNINKPILVKEKFWNVDTAFGLVPNHEFITHNYLYWFCVFFNFEKLNKTVTIPSLTKSDLLQIRIPIPAQNSLKKFEAVVAKLEEMRKREKESAETAANTVNALSQKAFSGKI